MFYISAASTISHQPTFKNDGYSATIGPLPIGSALLQPDYKTYIEPGLLRRMSKILRMSVAASKECLEQAGIAQPDAIVVGTGLGCLQDTEKFLTNSITIEGLLPPTSFIQSTHNTMAGQISLSLGNHGYNMTHTQNSLSFELVLQDAMLLLEEGENQVLVGAADEYIEFLSEVFKHLNAFTDKHLTSGASYFIISNEKGSGTIAAVNDCISVGLVNDIPGVVQSFLQENEVPVRDIGLILYTGVLGNIPNELKELGLNGKFVDYLALSGIYPTASAFALDYAVDQIRQDSSIKYILICNSLIKSNLGLTLIQAVEA